MLAPLLPGCEDYTADGEDGVATGDNDALPSKKAAPVISLHAIAGIRMEDTMSVPVYIHGHCLTALLDSGSTHNFINTGVMCRIRLEPVGAAMRVAVMNGNRIHCDGVAHNMAMRINQEDFSISCFDLILGIDYLHTLGPILWDFEDLSVSF